MEPKRSGLCFLTCYTPVYSRIIAWMVMAPALSFNSEIHVKIMFLYKIYIPFPLHFLFYEGWNPSDQGFVSSHVIRQYTAGSLPGWLWPQPLVSIVNFSVKIMLFTIGNHLIQFSLNNDKKSMRLPFSVHMLPTEHFT